MTAIAIIRVRDVFAAVMLSGIYGLLSASFFVTLDAVDVAFTEAAVGAGIFPLLMLAALNVTGRYEKPSTSQSVIPLFLVVTTGALLIMGTSDMPPFGAADAPAQQHVAVRYIQDSPQEIGIPNMVTSVLASYRGYDTLGEVVVIFTALVGILMLLSAVTAEHEQAHMKEHKVLRIVSKMLIPMILLFALYVQFHGDFGPGGGFQAGVIFAAGVILYTMLFGLGHAVRLLNPDILRLLAASGALIYGSVGIACMLAGGDFLDYSVLAENPISGQHIGIIVIELGVGITVAATMILIFFIFSQHSGRPSRTGNDEGRADDVV